MQFRMLALAFIALGALQLPSSAQTGAQTGARQWIDGGPTPTRYEIAITPNVADASFAGEARIAIRAWEAAPSVTMNALDLTIDSALIDNVRASVTSDEEAQTLTLTPRHPLAPGNHQIRIIYRGKIYDDAFGLFRVSYDAEGHTKQALATQFEPGDARRFAPMWDQPNRRAVFALTVTAPSDLMAISNMPAAHTQRLSGALTRTTFADTPAMASYLLFFGLGDFERVHTDVDGVDLGVIVRRGQTARAQYALQAGAESLRYYHEYFGVPYPLPKLDMVGVPGSSGAFAAMENWGAILYFDQYIMIDESRTSESSRQFVFNTVAHEIAHQWFGDLVTMNWWSDLWLNEGFASWMAAKATERLHPDWKPWLSQLSDGGASAMSLDARAGTHPVVQTVNTIEEANLAFDSITYEKGLAVIRMVEAYVGEDAFRTGVRNYIREHQYGNTETNDLWTAVQAASGQPVLEIAQSFTSQPGFPILSVDGSRCDTRNPQVIVTQRRFAMDDTARTAETWNVPIVARRVGQAPVRTVLAAQATSTIALGPGCGAFIVNAGQSGFFRTLYDRATLQQLTRTIGTLDGEDQLGILLDYYAFGRSGDAQFTDYLELMNALPAQVDPLIAADTTGSILAFANYAKGRASEPNVRSYGRRVLRPYFDAVGWTPRADETSNVAILRASLIGALGELGDQDIIAEARRRAEAGDEASLPASIRDATIGVYAANATPTQYDALLARARAATDFVEQRRLYLELASAKDEALARRTLELSLNDTVPRQLRPSLVQAVAGEHTRLAWDFFKAHRADLEALVDAPSRLEYPVNIAAASNEPAMATEFQAFTRDYPEGARPRVNGAIASITLRAQTIRERMPAVEAWIARHNTASGGAQRASRG